MAAHLTSATARSYELRCDQSGCPARFVPQAHRDTWYPSTVRDAARAAGWSTRPAYGRGARTAPDLCPTHWTPS